MRTIIEVEFEKEEEEEAKEKGLDCHTECVCLEVSFEFWFLEPLHWPGSADDCSGAIAIIIH